ncbi:vitellogenin-like [Pectinophora gossypiella]|uniref:vitellogenin-like n=1 Tax=Pectinophora gossypiella TaxID=13191 RepID=UPI00214F3BF0|nr:vitellogenin-like [Pectinophora gossypiella]
MKTIILTALLAAVVSAGLNSDSGEYQTEWPWQVGRLYRYDVYSYTLARLPEGASSGNALKATFIVRVIAKGKLQARLEHPQRAPVHQELLGKDQRTLPQDLKYEPVQNLEDPFEINLDGGRVLSLNMPSSVPLAYENLLKGLIGGLQVDLSTHRTVHSDQNNYDKEKLQGQFRKMETDVTGDVSTLYTVTPAHSEWRRELPNFSLTQDPILITKSKNYGHSHHRVGYHFGVPQEAQWTGTADKAKEQQFISRATTSRILAGRQGPIYKSETTSTVEVHPLVYGQQKAEVLSYVKLELTSYEEDKVQPWKLPEGSRVIPSLLYSMSNKQTAIHDSSEESREQQEADVAEQSSNRVRRSYRMPKKIVSINKIVIQKRNENENDDSSSSDSTSAYINDEIPMDNEPAYAALYMNPQAHKAQKQNPANAQKLVQETAQLLQNINNLPRTDFLSKFNILVRVIAAMDYEQLTQTSRSIEAAKASNNLVKTDMWMIYRDAVAQAGTLPAFKQIISWIQAKKIEREEAAQVVSTLVNTLRYPTKEIMIQFFELAINPEVMQQQYLNSSALVAATRFINMGHVNNETAHAYYPTHMYGRLARQHDNFVLEKILPRLSQGLEQAIQQEDSRKAQVYIKAIGQLAHRSILDVFAPYLEGKIGVSTYLRALMVDNLDKLAHQKDSYARAVFYSILRNTAEPNEVRLAAIHNIFVAHPTTAMMLAMAEMTHEDPSMQVRAILKSAILNAAKQKNPRHLDLARTAQAASPMLTKEMFGQQYSSKKYDDYFDNDYELGIMDVLSTSGSEDSLFPRYLRYGLRSQTSGWKTITASFSSVQQFVERFQQQMNKMLQQTPESQSNHKYSAEKISEMLKIKRDPQNPLEASLFLNLMNQPRFFSFSEEDFNELPIAMRDLFQKLAKGVDVHYTKVFNQAQINVMFPLANGMPFIYKYKEPTAIHVQGNIKGEMKYQNRNYETSIQKEIQFTYARNIDGSVGFLDTLANQYASAGVVNKLQLYIPMKLDLKMKRGEVKIRFEHLRNDQDSTIVHYSVWPYTANQKKDSLVPISLDPTTKMVTRNNKVVAIDSRFGQTTSSQYQLQGYSYSSDYRSFSRMFQSNDLLKNIILAVYQKDVALTHFNFKYLGKQSQNKAVTFTAVYDAFYNLKKTEMPLVAKKIEDVSPNSEARRGEIMKQVISGMNNPEAKVIDLSAVLEGPVKAEFVFTAAVGGSPVDSKIQYAFFASKNYAQGSNQITGVGKVNKPDVTALNPLEALKKELKMSFESEIKFGENLGGNVKINIQSERTKKYTEALQKLPLYKKVQEQVARNNYYQPEGHKMIVMAQAPDYFKASVTYKDVSPAFKYAIFQAYRIAEQYGSWLADVNPLKTTPEGKLDIEVQNNYLDNIMSLNFNSKYGEVRIKNVPIPRVAAGAFSVYTPIKPHERVANYYTRHQYQPYCTVDGTQIKTFSNRVYDYTLSPAWHVVMYDPRWQQHRDELVVLSRRPSQEKQDIYISYKSETGKDLEIEIESAGNKPTLKVNTNSKKVSEGDLTMYWDDAEQTPFLKYYIQPDGVLMLNIRENRLRAMYDGQRLVVLEREARNHTRGICGLMSGEPRDDYLTPSGLLLDNGEQYAASYALKDNSDPKTEQLQELALQLAYQRQYQYTTILRSDRQWRQWQKQESSEESSEDWTSRKVFRAKSYNRVRGPCALKKQVQYYENSNEICITTTPLDACSSHCKGENYQVKAAQVVCSSKLDQQYQQYVQQIQQGQNPKVSGVPQIRQYRVPSSCRA